MKKLIVLSAVILMISNVFASSFTRHVLWGNRGEIMIGKNTSGDKCVLLITEGEKNEFGTVLDIEFSLNGSETRIIDDRYMRSEVSLNLLYKEFASEDRGNDESRLEIYVGDAQTGDIIKTRYLENGKVIEECTF